MPRPRSTELRDEVEERRLSPLQVVEDQDERALFGQELEESADRPECLVGRSSRAAEPYRLAHPGSDRRRLTRHHRGNFGLSPLGVVVTLDARGRRDGLAHGEERDALAIGQASPTQHTRLPFEARDRLVDQAGLAHAGLAEDRRELGSPIPDRPPIRELQQRELVFPADVGRPTSRMWVALETEEPEALDAPRESFQLERAGRLGSHESSHESMRDTGEEDLAVTGLRLQAGREVGRAAEHGRAASGEHLTGRDPGADLETGPPSSFELVVQRVQRRMHLVGGANGPRCVVLVHLGGSERGNDRIADELLHRPAVALDGDAHRLVVARHQAAERFGVETLSERRRPHDIGEHDRDGAARSSVAGAGQGDPARRAEAGVGRHRRAACLAARSP